MDCTIYRAHSSIGPLFLRNITIGFRKSRSIDHWSKKNNNKNSKKKTREKIFRLSKHCLTELQSSINNLHNTNIHLYAKWKYNGICLGNYYYVNVKHGTVFRHWIEHLIDWPFNFRFLKTGPVFSINCWRRKLNWNVHENICAGRLFDLYWRWKTTEIRTIGQPMSNANILLKNIWNSAKWPH